VSVLDTFQQFGRDLFVTGLVSSHSGTLSARQEDRALITRRGAMLGHLTADDLVDIALDEESPVVADDASIHQGIYRATDAQAVIYARPPYTMALALLEDRLSPANGEGVEVLGSAPVLITQRALTSPDVAQLIGRILKENRVVALRGHGVFARGEDLGDALRVVTLLEEMCKVAQLYRALVREEAQPFIRDRQPSSMNQPGKNGGSSGGVRRPPSRAPQPRNTSGGGGGNWRRDEGAPRRTSNEPRQPGGGRRSGPPPHR
jgi:L-fuculose-phosphate aldolase